MSLMIEVQADGTATLNVQAYVLDLINLASQSGEILPYSGSEHARVSLSIHSY